MKYQKAPPPSVDAPVSAPGPSVQAGRGVLFVHPDPTPRFVPFPFVRAIIGRDPASGVPLQGRAVSWRHAELQLTGASTVVRDLDSTNGVQVEGRRVKEARLDDDGLLRVGDFLGVVSAEPWPTTFAEQLPEARALGLVVGPAMSRVLQPLMTLMPGRTARLAIEGETGTGKTLVARLAHARIGATRPLEMIDCASWDANADLTRLIDEARGGTVYLGNFTALAPKSQTRLLAALDELERGAVTLIAGSQESLSDARKRGDFLPPLAEAFSSHALRLPLLQLLPLRSRRAEIPALFRHLLAVHGEGRRPLISTDVMERLCLYDWPCNVRELGLLARRLLSLHGDEIRLRLEHLPPHLAPSDREDTTLPVAPVVTGVNLNKLLDAVRDAGGNIAGAALQLGITRERAYRLIDRLGAVSGSS